MMHIFPIYIHKFLYHPILNESHMLIEMVLLFILYMYQFLSNHPNIVQNIDLMVH